MRKSVIFILITLALLSLVCALIGCSWNPPDVDEQAIENLVLQYMEDKYHVSFEIVDGPDAFHEGLGYERTYYEADIKLQNSETNVSYVVTIKPNWVDNNHDGFCDSYNITGENYSYDYCQSFVKPWIETIVKDNVDYEDTIVFARAEYQGYTDDQTLPEDMEFYYCKKQNTLITFYIYISNSEYENNPNYENSTKNLIDFMNDSEMQWKGYLFVYADEDFSKLKEYSTYMEFVEYTSNLQSMGANSIFWLNNIK